MRRIFISLLTLLTISTLTTFANDCCNTQSKYDYSQDYRCTQLIQRVKSQRNTLYNVLNLSEKQQDLKDEIETRKNIEMEPVYKNFNIEKQKLLHLAQTDYNSKSFKKQRKVTKKAWKKVKKVRKKYDKEIMKILCNSQKAKYKEITKLVRRDIRYCYLNKKACPKNPYMNTFGKSDALNVCEVCDKHSHPHLFNYKCKFIEELEQE